MNNKIVTKIAYAFGVMLGWAITLLLCGFIIKFLWNWLMPTIFGLTTITFSESIGIYLLSECIFKRPFNFSLDFTKEED